MQNVLMGMGIVDQMLVEIFAKLRSDGLTVGEIMDALRACPFFDALLRLAAEAGLDDEMVFTLEAVLTDKGRNVRNRVAHGWIQKKDCTATLAARIVQLLLMLATLRMEEVKT